MDLASFAREIGDADAGSVTITGLGSRGGPMPDSRVVRAPAGIRLIDAEEMVVTCGAGTAVGEVQAALGEVGQRAALPEGGTVGGVLAVGHSGIRRLGDGPVRETLLQAEFVGAHGQVVKAGGPTVKNVSGFDLCKLLVGSRGTLGFLGEVRLRTQPIAARSQWFVTEADPWKVLNSLYRPVSVLWTGIRTFVLLEGHAEDVREQASANQLIETAAPPSMPNAGRVSMTPDAIRSLQGTVGFVAEIGVGIVHTSFPSSPLAASPGVRRLNERLKSYFDPAGRLNPGLCLLDV